MNPLCIPLLFHQMSPKIIQKVNIKEKYRCRAKPTKYILFGVNSEKHMLNGYLLGNTFSKTNITRLLYILHRCENSHHKFTEYNECFFQVDFSSFKATKRGDVSKSSTSAMAELEFWTLECYKRAISQVNNHIRFFFIPEVF